MRKTLITFGILQVLLILKLNYNNAVEFKLTNFVCETYNKSWYVINQCRLRAISRNKTTLHFNGTILYPVNNIDVHFGLMKRENGYKPWLYNITIDFCRYLRRPYNPLAIIVFKLFQRFSNMNHTCPHVGHQIITGFYLRPEVLRLPFPTGDYLLVINWFYDKKLTIKTDAYFKFVEDL